MQVEGGQGEYGGYLQQHGSDVRKTEYQFCDQLFHDWQQSVLMHENLIVRNRLMFEQKRLADIAKIRCRGGFPDRLPMLEMIKGKVTLCIEVAGADQLQASDRISTGMAALLHDFRTLIRLPERNPARPEFINQVTISGQLHEVERVRQCIREMGTISVTLPLMDCKVHLSRVAIWLEKSKRDGSLPFPYLIILPRKDYPALDIVGATTQEESVKAAVKVLLKQLFNPEQVHEVPVFTIINVASAYQNVFTDDVMVLISTETGATVHFPTTEINPQSPILTLICSGRVESVLSARKMILGLLPVQLSLDMELSEREDAVISEEDRSKNCFIAESNITLRVERSELEPRPRLPHEKRRHFVTLCTSEFNIQQMYKMAAGMIEANSCPDVAPCSLFTPTVTGRLFSLIAPIYAPNRMYPLSVEDRNSMCNASRMLPEGFRDCGRGGFHRLPPPPITIPPIPNPLPSLTNHQTEVMPRIMEGASQPAMEEEKPSSGLIVSVPPLHSIILPEGERLATILESHEENIGHLNPKKSLLEQIGKGRMQTRETPKHTLELKTRAERQEKQSDGRWEDVSAEATKVTIDVGGDDKPDAARDGRTSYAQVLQQQKHLGRIKPMELIARVEEECSSQRDAPSAPFAPSEEGASQGMLPCGSARVSPAVDTPSLPSSSLQSAPARPVPPAVETGDTGGTTYASVARRKEMPSPAPLPSSPAVVFSAASFHASLPTAALHTADTSRSGASREELLSHASTHNSSSNGFAAELT